MPVIKVLENESVTLWHYPEQGIVHHQFHHHIWGERFRETLNAGLEVFRKQHATKWLSDDRKNCALSQEDTEWSMQEWFPRVLEAGWTHWAIVLPEHVVGQMNMKRFIDAYAQQGVTTRVFSEPTPALRWLEGAEALSSIAPPASV